MKRKEKKSLVVSASRSDVKKVNKKSGEKAEKKRIGFDFSYLFSAILTVAVAIASMGMVFYFGYHLVNTFTSDITTATAYDITESEYRRGVGYIFRYEENITSELGGTPDYRIEDGARVAKDELLCDMYAALTEDIRSKVEEIDREIAVLEAIVDKGVVQTGIPEALASANQSYADIMAHLARGEYGEAALLTDSFRIALNRVAWLEGDRGDIENTISSLYAERSGLIASYGKKMGSVNSEAVGYFFRNSDGYEDIFDPALLSEMTVGEFAELIERKPSDTSKCVGKLLGDAKWYVCVPLDSVSAKGFKAGESYNIVFNDNSSRTFAMTLERLVLDIDDHDADGDRGEALLIFASKEMPKDFKYFRTQNISIELTVYRGYRIPITAVRYLDGMTGVYTLNGGYVLFRQIDIIYEGNGYYIAADYADAEPGKPKTYTVLGFSEKGAVGDYASLDELALNMGWEKKIYDNGGIPVVKGQNLKYFYHLDDLEQIILTGKDLYHGKALD